MDKKIHKINLHIEYINVINPLSLMYIKNLYIFKIIHLHKLFYIN